MATRKKKLTAKPDRGAEPDHGAGGAAAPDECTADAVTPEGGETRVLGRDELKHLAGGGSRTIRIRIRDSDLTGPDRV